MSKKKKLLIAAGAIANEEDESLIQEQMAALESALDFVIVADLDASISVTYGCAFGKVETKEDFRNLFKTADQSLYEAKRNTN